MGAGFELEAAVVQKLKHLPPNVLDIIRSFSFEVRLPVESNVADTRKIPWFSRALRPTVGRVQKENDL